MYRSSTIDFYEELEGMDLVVVHEWNSPEVVQGIGRTRAASKRFRLLFHDTHHRSVTNPGEMEKYDLSEYDVVLAFGETIRDIYLERDWAARAWTWHEAADTRDFRPIRLEKEGDAVWIGNWGDGERTAELGMFLLEPVAELGLRGRAYGVRYPREAREALGRARIGYGGWLPNYRAPQAFARFRFTVHIPRRPHVLALPGIPTIRPFEAMACGIPLICSPWEDSENLFPARTT